MATLTIKNLPDPLYAQLKDRAVLKAFPKRAMTPAAFLAQ